VVSDTDLAREEEIAERFYTAALTEAERADFCEALGVEGVDDEVALLRLRLREAFKQRPEDLVLALKGVELLTRIVAVRYRLPGTREKALRRATRRTVEELDLETAEKEKRDE
jgi:hypothetical protein